VKQRYRITIDIEADGDHQALRTRDDVVQYLGKLMPVLDAMVGAENVTWSEITWPVRPPG
jgi:hypothetical protein